MKIGDYADIKIGMDMIEINVHENLVSRSFMVRHQDMRVLGVLQWTMKTHQSGIPAKCVSKCPMLNENWTEILSSLATLVSLELVEVVGNTQDQMFRITDIGMNACSIWSEECAKNGWNYPVIHCPNNCFLT